MDAKRHFSKVVTWEQTEVPEYPYEAFVEGHLWKIKLRNLPVEYPYTLIIDDHEIMEFKNFPSVWKRWGIDCGVGFTAKRPTDYLLTPVTWKATGNGEFPQEAIIDGQLWKIRVNDWPEEAFYTLMIDDHEIVDFDRYQWPTDWKR